MQSVRLEQTIHALVPREARVAVAVGPVVPMPALYPGEAISVAGAVDKRRHEFAVGRHLARSALCELGFGMPSIPVGARREPLWPAGVVGSITHCDGLCSAVVAPEDRVAGLGLDAEIASSVDASLLQLLATPAERTWLARRPPALCAVVFSAKESVFKCVFPRWRQFLEFVDVELAVDPDGTFVARRGPDYTQDIVGRWALIDDYAITTAFIRHP